MSRFSESFEKYHSGSMSADIFFACFIERFKQKFMRAEISFTEILSREVNCSFEEAAALLGISDTEMRKLSEPLGN